MTLKSRIEKLEHKAAPTGFHVVPMRYGEDRDEAIARAGIEPGPNDTVVFIVKFSDGDFA